MAHDFGCVKHICRNRKERKDSEVEVLPVPRVENGKWSKERERTKSGRWRRKRSDANKPRKKSSRIKYALAALAGVIIVVLIVVVFFYPQLLGLPRLF